MKLKWRRIEEELPPALETILGYWVHYDDDDQIVREEYGLTFRVEEKDASYDEGNYVLPDAYGAVVARPTHWCRIERPSDKLRQKVSVIQEPDTYLGTTDSFARRWLRFLERIGATHFSNQGVNNLSFLWKFNSKGEQADGR